MNSTDLVYDQVEAPYIKTDSTVARKKFRLRLSERADFQIVSTLFRAVQALAMRIYMSFSEKKLKNCKLFVYPRSTLNVSVRSRSNWILEFEVLVFEERGKPEYPEKNLSEQEREPTVELMSLLSYVNDSRKDLVKSRRL